MSMIEVRLEVSGIHPVCIPCGSAGIVFFKSRQTDDGDAIDIVTAGVYCQQLILTACKNHEPPGVSYHRTIRIRMRPEDRIPLIQFTDVKLEQNDKSFETQQHRWVLTDGPPLRKPRVGTEWITLTGAISLEKDGTFVFHEQAIDVQRTWRMVK